MLCFTATECSLCFQPPRSRHCIYENIEQKYTPDITQLRKFERWLPGLYSLPLFFPSHPSFFPSTISSHAVPSHLCHENENENETTTSNSFFLKMRLLRNHSSCFVLARATILHKCNAWYISSSTKAKAFTRSTCAIIDIV